VAYGLGYFVNFSFRPFPMIAQLTALGVEPGMDVEKSSRAPIAFRESCRAAAYTVLLMLAPFAITGVITVMFLDEMARFTGGCCIAAFAILRFVRWTNRRDDPHRVNLPPDTP
jgi:hypothetical protein